MSPSATPKPRRRHTAQLAIALVATACALLLMDTLHAGPSWTHGPVSLAALVSALAGLVAGELSWERTLSAAQATGLVELGEGHGS